MESVKDDLSARYLSREEEMVEIQLQKIDVDGQSHLDPIDLGTLLQSHQVLHMQSAEARRRRLAHSWVYLANRVAHPNILGKRVDRRSKIHLSSINMQ